MLSRSQPPPKRPTTLRNIQLNTNELPPNPPFPQSRIPLDFPPGYRPLPQSLQNDTIQQNLQALRRRALQTKVKSIPNPNRLRNKGRIGALEQKYPIEYWKIHRSKRELRELLDQYRKVRFYVPSFEVILLTINEEVDAYPELVKALKYYEESKSITNYSLPMAIGLGKKEEEIKREEKKQSARKIQRDMPEVNQDTSNILSALEEEKKQEQEEEYLKIMMDIDSKTPLRSTIKNMRQRSESNNLDDYDQDEWSEVNEARIQQDGQQINIPRSMSKKIAPQHPSLNQNNQLDSAFLLSSSSFQSKPLQNPNQNPNYTTFVSYVKNKIQTDIQTTKKANLRYLKQNSHFNYFPNSRYSIDFRDRFQQRQRVKIIEDILLNQYLLNRQNPYDRNWNNRRIFIKSLTANFFKSFAEYAHTFDLLSGYNMILGPNGEGKSNIFDAILFVFGINAKNLRSNKMEDLVNLFYKQNYAKTKEFTHNECYVELVMSYAAKDQPEQKFIPLRNEPEARIVRKIDKNNVSSYYINGNEADADDVRGILEEYWGIDITTKRFLCQQGLVENFILLKPKGNEEEQGLLELFEEVAETAYHGDDIQDNLEEVKDVRQVIEHFENRLFITEKNLINQVDIGEIIEFYETSNKFLRLAHYNLALGKERTKKYMEIYFTELIKTIRIKDERKQVEVVYDNDKDYSAISRKEYELLREQHQQTISELEQNCQELFLESEELEKTVIEQSNEIELLYGKMYNKIQSIQQKTQLKTLKLQALQQFKKNTKLHGEKIQYLEKILKKEDAWKHFPAFLANNFAKIASLKRDLQTQLKQINTRNEKLTQTRQQITKLISQKKQKQQQFQKIKQQIAELAQTQDNIKIASSQISKQRTEKLQELQIQEKKLDSIQQQLKTISNQNVQTKSLAEKIKASNIPGVYGRLGDLGHCQNPKYEQVISTVAAGPLNQIVCDNFDTTIKVIEYVKTSLPGVRVICVALNVLEKYDAIIEKIDTINYGSDGVLLYKQITASEPMFNRAFYHAVRDYVYVEDRNKFQDVVKLNEGKRNVYTPTEFPGATFYNNFSNVRGHMTNKSGLIGKSQKPKDYSQTISRLKIQQKQQLQKVSEIQEKLQTINSDSKKIIESETIIKDEISKLTTENNNIIKKFKQLNSNISSKQKEEKEETEKIKKMTEDYQKKKNQHIKLSGGDTLEKIELIRKVGRENVIRWQKMNELIRQVKDIKEYQREIEELGIDEDENQRIKEQLLQEFEAIAAETLTKIYIIKQQKQQIKQEIENILHQITQEKQRMTVELIYHFVKHTELTLLDLQFLRRRIKKNQLPGQQIKCELFDTMENLQLRLKQQNREDKKQGSKRIKQADDRKRSNQSLEDQKQSDAESDSSYDSFESTESEHKRIQKSFGNIDRFGGMDYDLQIQLLNQTFTDQLDCYVQTNKLSLKLTDAHEDVKKYFEPLQSLKKSASFQKYFGYAYFSQRRKTQADLQKQKKEGKQINYEIKPQEQQIQPMDTQKQQQYKQQYKEKLKLLREQQEKDGLQSPQVILSDYNIRSFIPILQNMEKINKPFTPYPLNLFAKYDDTELALLRSVQCSLLGQYQETFQRLEFFDKDGICQDWQKVRPIAERATYLRQKIEEQNVEISYLLKQNAVSNFLRIFKFNRAFLSISVHFQRIYNMLTDGGNCRIESIAKNAPFKEGLRIIAQPPQKQWSEVTKLSGGEKSMLALSLLFAFHEFSPNPLFLLDEIDAAFDEPKTQILAKYLEKLSHTAQIFQITHRKLPEMYADQYLFVMKNANNMTSLHTVLGKRRTLANNFESSGKKFETVESQLYYYDEDIRVYLTDKNISMQQIMNPDLCQIWCQQVEHYQDGCYTEYLLLENQYRLRLIWAILLQYNSSQLANIFNLNGYTWKSHQQYKFDEFQCRLVFIKRLLTNYLPSFEPRTLQLDADEMKLTEFHKRTDYFVDKFRMQNKHNEKKAYQKFPKEYVYIPIPRVAIRRAERLEKPHLSIYYEGVYYDTRIRNRLCRTEFKVGLRELPFMKPPYWVPDPEPEPQVRNEQGEIELNVERNDRREEKVERGRNDGPKVIVEGELEEREEREEMEARERRQKPRKR